MYSLIVFKPVLFVETRPLVNIMEPLRVMDVRDFFEDRYEDHMFIPADLIDAVKLTKVNFN